MGTANEIEVILRRFGDEQSTLMDRYERLSVEVRLNQAMLGRSLSEPSVSRTQLPPAMAPPVRQGRPRRGSGFTKVLKRLLKPILRRRGGRKELLPDPEDPIRSWNKFSRSTRV